MSTKQDILSPEDVKVFVDAFYGKIQQDELLAPIFAKRIVDGNWTPHLERMYGFWGAVLLNTRTYVGRPFAKHIGLPIDKEHFDHWVTLFTETIHTYFEGDVAEEAKRRAHLMSSLFQAKFDHMRSNPNLKNLL